MKKIILIFSFLICLYSPAKGTWTPTAPMSGSTNFVYAMTSNSDGDLFASSWAIGIYKSINQGVSWIFA